MWCCRNPPTSLPSLQQREELGQQSWTFRSSALCSSEANLSQEIWEQGKLRSALVPCSSRSVICILPTAQFALISLKSKREFLSPLLEVLFSWDSGLESCSSSELQACDLLSSWAQAPAHQGDKENEKSLR